MSPGSIVRHLAFMYSPGDIQEWGKCLHLHLRGSRILCSRKFCNGLLVSTHVCSHGEGDPHVTMTHYALNLTLRGHPTLSPTPDMGHGDIPGPTPLLVTSGCNHWRSVQTCSLDLTVQGLHPRPVLTSGGHRSMHGWQAGGTHPT